MRINKFIILLIFCILTAACNQNNNKYYVTAQSGLNVRSTPNEHGTIQGKLKHYDQIDVISIENGWAKIEYKDKVAYIKSEYISESVSLHWYDWIFFGLGFLLFGGGFKAIPILIHKKDGTLDRRYKVNRGH
ncbi:MAG: SH3 domain-containing protein [Paludibacteraceae bacterium]|nr:SH3 domain-containing protein [Paludibacteraceae bacterium]